jgi:integrase/recombinase XerD
MPIAADARSEEPRGGAALTDGLSETIASFLAYMAQQRRVATNTVTAYRNDLNQFVSYLRSWTGDKPGPEQQIGVQFLDAAAVAGFVLYLREKGYAQATVARKLAAVKSFFHYTADMGLVPRNPASGLDSPRVRRIAPQAVDPADVRALLEDGCAGDTPGDRRDRAMLTLLYHSGMRVSELVTLDVADFDGERSAVHCRGRNGRVRTIPLADQAREMVRDYLDVGRPALARPNEAEDQPLFLNHRGMRLTRQGFWLIMRERARHAHIDAPITPHALRHSFALHQLGSGTPLRDLKELLGHVNISTTQVYALADRGVKTTV